MTSWIAWLWGAGEAAEQPAEHTAGHTPEGGYPAWRVRLLVLPTHTCHLEAARVTAALQTALDHYAGVAGDAEAAVEVTAVEPKLARVHLRHKGGPDAKVAQWRAIFTSYLASALALDLLQPVMVVPTDVTSTAASASPAAPLGGSTAEVLRPQVKPE